MIFYLNEHYVLRNFQLNITHVDIDTDACGKRYRWNQLEYPHEKNHNKRLFAIHHILTSGGHDHLA